MFEIEICTSKIVFGRIGRITTHRELSSVAMDKLHHYPNALFCRFQRLIAKMCIFVCFVLSNWCQVLCNILRGCISLPLHLIIDTDLEKQWLNKRCGLFLCEVILLFPLHVYDIIILQ